jgi:hypothetical protein
VPFSRLLGSGRYLGAGPRIDWRGAGFQDLRATPVEAANLTAMKELLRLKSCSEIRTSIRGEHALHIHSPKIKPTDR